MRLPQAFGGPAAVTLLGGWVVTMFWNVLGNYVDDRVKPMRQWEPQLVVLADETAPAPDAR